MEHVETTGKKAIYIGEPTLTRGDYGDNVTSGVVDTDGYVWVWDGTYGWSCWGKPSPEEWKIEEGETVPLVGPVY